MEKLQDIDDKILKLKKLKGDLEIRLGRALYRKAQAILGEDFTPHLALVILSEIWKESSVEQKKAWKEKARTFPFSGFSKISPKE